MVQCHCRDGIIKRQFNSYFRYRAMILFQLGCANHHQFEAWFRDSATYDKQVVEGDINCPYCGDSNISKAPMAPYLAKEMLGREDAESRARDVAEQIVKAVNKLRWSVEESCEYVGDDFADEARSVHYGETEERAIYGEATEEEASELEEEGIEFYRIPAKPRRND